MMLSTATLEGAVTRMCGEKFSTKPGNAVGFDAMEWDVM